MVGLTLRRTSPNLHFATCLDVRPARSLQRVARAQNKLTFHHMFWRPKCTISADAKKCRISPHHMLAHPTRAISAEGCPRTNKTRISPHVWVSDTPQRVTFRKLLAGCPCRRREIEELEKSDLQEFRYNLITWKLPELLWSNSSVTISVQMTLQESCRSSSRSGSPASQVLCK